MVSGNKAGVAGFIILMPALFMTLILGVLAFADPALLVVIPLWYFISDAIGGIIFAIGVLLISIGAMRFGKYYKNTFSSITGIIGLVTVIMGLVGVIIGMVARLVLVTLLDAVNILGLVTAILQGVFFILLGVSFIILRSKIGSSGLSLATGILAIISGAFLCSLLLGIVGVIMLIPTAICAAYLFLKAKGISEEEAKEVKKLAVRLVAPRKPRLKPEEIDAEVHKYVKKHPEELNIAECAESLGVSEEDVRRAVKALVKKGKLEMG